MKITAIILTYNRPDALEAVLKSILMQKLMPFEVIIADDGSTPETAKLLSDYKSKFPVDIKHVWHEDKGYRIAAIRNKAIKISSGDCLLFSDGDLIFHPKFFYDLTKNMKKKTALIGSRVFLTKEKTYEILKNISIKKIPFFSSKIDKNRLNSVRIAGLAKLMPYKKFSANLRGGLLCVWKKDMENINGWNEDFEGWGKEDTELVARLYFTGIKLKKLKFAGLTYHLWHPVLTREKIDENELILANCISNESKWCPNGLVKS